MVMVGAACFYDTWSLRRYTLPISSRVIAGVGVVDVGSAAVGLRWLHRCAVRWSYLLWHSVLPSRCHLVVVSAVRHGSVLHCMTIRMLCSLSSELRLGVVASHLVHYEIVSVILNTSA